MLILYLIIRYKTKQANNQLQAARQEFWNKEYKANETRKKDISHLPYIQVPLQSLPMESIEDETLQELYQLVTDLSTCPIINLTGISNTDLKIKYGVSNLSILSEADNNFTQLIGLINKWGTYLYKIGNIKDAKVVLSYGITCKSDISNNYTLLATIYKDLNEKKEIEFLIEQASTLNSLRKDSLVLTLKEILNS